MAQSGHPGGAHQCPLSGVKRTLVSRGGRRGSPVPRFYGEFRGMDVTIDDLKVWQSPVSKQSRPGRLAVVAPHSE
jgi:hypothetical protein